MSPYLRWGSPVCLACCGQNPTRGAHVEDGQCEDETQESRTRRTHNGSRERLSIVDRVFQQRESHVGVGKLEQISVCTENLHGVEYYMLVFLYLQTERQSCQVLVVCL